jgi:hypothetical protein
LADVLPRDEGRVQLSITGKGGKARQVLLPKIVSRALLSPRGTPAPMIPCSQTVKVAGRLTGRAVKAMV